MGRAPATSSGSSRLKKGPWTAEEDLKLKEYIEQHGAGNWRTVPQNAGLQRCGKSCRLRWTNYLRPDIKRGRFSFEEEEAIIQLHSVLGNKWSAIAARLPGRTDNEIKNYWNTHIRKRLLRMGLDPVTHAPRLDHLLAGSTSQLNNLSSLLFLLSQQQMVNPQALNIVSNLLSLNQHTHIEQLQHQTDSCIPQQDQLQSFSSSFLQTKNEKAERCSTNSSLDDLHGLVSQESNYNGGRWSQMLPGLADDTAAGTSSFVSFNNNNQQLISDSTPFASYTSSSPLDSSYTSNGLSAEDEIDSFLNFNIPEGFHLSELLYHSPHSKNV